MQLCQTTKILISILIYLSKSFSNRDSNRRWLSIIQRTINKHFMLWNRQTPPLPKSDFPLTSKSQSLEKKPCDSSHKPYKKFISDSDDENHVQLFDWLNKTSDPPTRFAGSTRTSGIGGLDWEQFWRVSRSGFIVEIRTICDELTGFVRVLRWQRAYSKQTSSKASVTWGQVVSGFVLGLAKLASPNRFNQYESLPPNHHIYLEVSQMKHSSPFRDTVETRASEIIPFLSYRGFLDSAMWCD